MTTISGVSTGDIGIFVLLPRAASRLETSQEIVELRVAVAGDRIRFRVDANIVRHRWQSRAMRHDVEQRDRPAAHDEPDLGRQIPLQRVVECDLAALDHVREQQAGEGLGQRPDLEDGPAIEGPTIGRAAAAGHDDPPPFRADEADDDAYAAALQTCEQQGAHLLVGGETGPQRRRFGRVGGPGTDRDAGQQQGQQRQGYPCHDLRHRFSPGCTL
jgi:hypothetical protein